jgi:hypothetical protein
MFTEKDQKGPNYFCKKCDYKCSKLAHWNRHIATTKHQNVYKMFTISDQMLTNLGPNLDHYSCTCGKEYKHRQSLYVHKKTCSNNGPDLTNSPGPSNPDFKTNMDLISYLIKENQEFKSMILEVVKKDTTNISNINSNNSNTNNSNNKTFNLQVFLNETCKDALNISDFVNQISVSLEDFEETGRLGFAEGISKIFVKKLNTLDINMRPIHCSDLKRETLYIKNDNQWIKDDEERTILINSVKQVANKNIKQISEWQKAHPGASDPRSRHNDKYLKFVSNAMSGVSKEECSNNYEKIIRNIVKGTVINKLSPVYESGI